MTAEQTTGWALRRLRGTWLFHDLPDAALAPLTRTAGILTVIAMAALGLGVDVRVVARVGGRVTLAVTASLGVLLVVSIALVRGLGIS